MRHLLNPLDFTVEETNRLLDLASDIEKNPDKYAHLCEGKKIATLFYEPSTRTRMSLLQPLTILSRIPKNTARSVTAKSWRPCSLSLRPVPV